MRLSDLSSFTQPASQRQKWNVIYTGHTKYCDYYYLLCGEQHVKNFYIVLPCEVEIISIFQIDIEYLAQILINWGTAELEFELQPVIYVYVFKHHYISSSSTWFSVAALHVGSHHRLKTILDFCSWRLWQAISKLALNEPWILVLMPVGNPFPLCVSGPGTCF